MCLVTVDQEQGTVMAEAGATVSSIHIALERAAVIFKYGGGKYNEQ